MPQINVLKPSRLSFLGIMIVLLGLAGCSSYEPKIRTGAKAAPLRTPQQVVDDIVKVCSETESLLYAVKDAASAAKATPDLNTSFDRLKDLVKEAIASLRRESPEDRQAFLSKAEGRMSVAQAGLLAAANDRATSLPDLPPDFKPALDKIKRELPGMMQEVNNVQNEPAAPPSAEFVADSQPEGSGWAVWVLCLLILAVCVAFLCRDGLWNNAIRLVNVVFAGLLAMNFYEWLATWVTKVSESVTPWQPLMDFLSMWTCFVLFMVVFRTATEAVSQVRVRFLKVADQAGGIALSLCIGWVMVCFTMASLHAGPLGQYPLMGSFQPQNKMVFGLFAPDREWLGFIKYQSLYGYCRAVDQDCSFPSDFIENQMQRRQHIEKYISGNHDHAILVNKQFMKAAQKPGGR